MMNQADDHSWRSNQFRQSVISRLEEAMQKNGALATNSSTELENHIFKKASNKDEYLAYVAKLLLRLRGPLSNAMMSQQGISHQGIPQHAIPQTNMPQSRMSQQNLPQQQSMPQVGLTQLGMQQQNMPQQGRLSSINTATNLLQSLNQGRVSVQNRMPMQVETMNSMSASLGPMQQSPVQSGMIHGGLMNQINVVMGNQMNPTVNPSLGNVMPGSSSLINVNAMNSQIVNTTSMPNTVGIIGPIPNSMSGSIPSQVGGRMTSQMVGQVSPQIGGGIVHNQMHVPIAAQQQKLVSDGMMMAGQGGVLYSHPRGPTPPQFIRQNTPAGAQPIVQVNSAMIPSPALFPSTNPTQMNAAGFVATVMKPAGPIMTPSPNSSVSLSTPGGQSQPTPSPLSNEEQAYCDKVKQLSRYIEPLRRMIARSGSGDHEKMSKMKKLLEILSSPCQRITMEALLKCEAVLEKMDIKGLADMKEQHPLVEAISSALQGPNPNHTFQRTFELVMSTLNGKPLKTLPKPLKRKHVEEIPSDIPEALQGEVARLDQRFKVSLDPVQQTSPKCVYLLCWLDDRNLPCIPPVQITIPEDYPNSSPKCNLSNYEYGATKFLQMIQKALQSRLAKLSSKYTMSQLLDTWENSVRETCSSYRINGLGSVF